MFFVGSPGRTTLAAWGALYVHFVLKLNVVVVGSNTSVASSVGAISIWSLFGISSLFATFGKINLNKLDHEDAYRADMAIKYLKRVSHSTRSILAEIDTLIILEASSLDYALFLLMPAIFRGIQQGKRNKVNFVLDADFYGLSPFASPENYEWEGVPPLLCGLEGFAKYNFSNVFLQKVYKASEDESLQVVLKFLATGSKPGGVLV